MKKSRKNNQKTRINPQGPDSRPPKRVFKKPRILMYRLLTMLLVPAFLLGVLELALRVSGYGYPTSYFVKSRIDDKDFLIPNDFFSYRFS